MSRTAIATPPSRSWRDIPQQVKSRSMSREGRRRVWLRGLRLAGSALTLAALCWTGWQVARVWRSDLRAVPEAGARPIGKNIALATDGVLDRAWLERTLGLPKKATLMDLNLTALRARLLADGQVASADLLRKFPATLSVHISERTPVARLLAESSGGRSTLLVARDGVVYRGTDYDEAMVRSLPWLDGVKLEAVAGGFAPIAGMAEVADLLARARLEDEPLYQTWEAVSLDRLVSDRELAVRLRGGVLAIFGTRDDFFGQLARLDYVLDAAARAHPGQPLAGVIDLSLGTSVAVRLQEAVPAAPVGDQGQRAGADPLHRAGAVPASTASAPHFHLNFPSASSSREF